MKTRFFIVVLLVITFKSNSYGQFSFGVSPGIGFNSAYFGYKVNDKIVPFIGFQYLNANFKYEHSQDGYYGSYTDELTFSGSLYVPNLGVKCFLKQQDKLQAYLSLSLSKPFLGGKVKIDGEVDEDFKDDIKKFSLWGAEFGFGAEYFFDEHFSLGGEYGIRYMHLKNKDSYTSEMYDPGYSGVSTETEYKFNMSPTFSKISFNYYF